MLFECHRCGEWRLGVEFRPNINNRYGIGQHRCNPCNVKRERIKKLKNPERHQLNREKRYIEKRGNKLEWCKRTFHNHRVDGIYFHFGIQELYERIKDVTTCAYCLKELTWLPKVAFYKNGATLERINNGLVLNLKDVCIICGECNKTKDKRTMEEFLSYIELIHSRREELKKLVSV